MKPVVGDEDLVRMELLRLTVKMAFNPVGGGWVSSSPPLRVPDRAALLEEEGLLLAGGDEGDSWWSREDWCVARQRRLLWWLGKERPREVGGTEEVCATGFPVMAALLWLVAEDEEESVGAV